MFHFNTVEIICFDFTEMFSFFPPPPIFLHRHIPMESFWESLGLLLNIPDRKLAYLGSILCSSNIPVWLSPLAFQGDCQRSSSGRFDVISQFEQNCFGKSIPAPSLRQEVECLHGLSYYRFSNSVLLHFHPELCSTGSVPGAHGSVHSHPWLPLSLSPSSVQRVHKLSALGRSRPLETHIWPLVFPHPWPCM